MSKKFKEFMKSVENMHSNKEKMTRDAIYRLLRGTFHSQSGLFLNKEQCMALCMVIYNFKQNQDGEKTKHSNNDS